MARPDLAPHVATSLLRRLAAGDWPPGTALPPTRQLARTLRVSPPVLLAALRDLGRRGLLRVVQRRRTVVLPEAAQLAATLLAEQATESPRRVALLIPESELEPRATFHQSMIRHLGLEAPRMGLRTETVAVSLNDQVALADSLTSRRFSAAIGLSFLPTCSPLLCRLKEQRFPVVLVNRHFPWLNLPTVAIGNEHAIELLGDRLLQLGHRNLCMISHFLPSDSPSGRNWVGDWLDYVRRRELLSTCTLPVLALPWHPVFRESRHLFSNLFQAPGRPTAVIFTAALWANHFLADPRFARVRVPEDVSLVVMTPGRQVFCPGSGICLTHLDIDHRRAAQCLLDMVRQMLAGRLDQTSVRIPLDVRFTESIGPAPQRAGDAF